jgi:hypothetical protein
MDDIVDFPIEIIKLLSQDQIICAFLLDNPDVDIINDEVDLIGKQIFDYNYIQGTQTNSLSYIFVEATILESTNEKTKTLRIWITVASSKTNMDLNPSKFIGIAGNRRDNLIRRIDKLIRDTDKLGIGRLQLAQRNPLSFVSVGNENYTAKQLVYDIPNFSMVRRTS